MTTTGVEKLLAREVLPPAYLDNVERWWRPLAGHIAEQRRAAGRPLLIGINGAQGSGKSTLCIFLEALLTEAGLAAATLSLDDLYLTHAERAALAEAVHPLFATRGVPGTHDLTLADRTITSLLTGTGPVAIPRFDKARDDRRPPDDWPRVAAPLDVLLFEGWCIGATPEAESALVAAINPLEAREDPQSVWRRHANTALATDYAALFARLDRLIILRAPAFEAVQAWRFEQETKLRHARGAGAGMDSAALLRFIQHFERLTRHMLASLDADDAIIIDLDADRTIRGLRGL